MGNTTRQTSTGRLEGISSGAILASRDEAMDLATELLTARRQLEDRPMPHDENREERTARIDNEIAALVTEKLLTVQGCVRLVEALYDPARKRYARLSGGPEEGEDVGVGEAYVRHLGVESPRDIEPSAIQIQIDHATKPLDGKIAQLNHAVLTLQSRVGALEMPKDIPAPVSQDLRQIAARKEEHGATGAGLRLSLADVPPAVSAEVDRLRAQGWTGVTDSRTRRRELLSEIDLGDFPPGGPDDLPVIILAALRQRGLLAAATRHVVSVDPRDLETLLQEIQRRRMKDAVAQAVAKTQNDLADARLTDPR